MVLNGMAPQCVSDLIRKKSSCQSALRSNDLKMLHVVMHTAVERNVRHWVIRHLPKLGLQCGTSFQRPIRWHQTLILFFTLNYKQLKTHLFIEAYMYNF